MADWPYAMKRKTAAAFCDMSESAFEGEVMRGTLPASINLGGREHWLKPALETAIARLAGEDDEPEYLKRFNKRYG